MKTHTCWICVEVVETQKVCYIPQSIYFSFDNDYEMNKLSSHIVMHEPIYVKMEST